MLLLGIDLGTSSIKVSVVDAGQQKALAEVQYPETETEIISEKAGWAEQSAELWWENIKQAIRKCHSSGLYNPSDIAAIGISYQMHGLVIVDKNGEPLRNAIIWCDSRNVAIGDKAFQQIGPEKCLSHLLNSPGTFTASKLAWVKDNEPDIYGKVDRVLLPGDYVAMKFTGEMTTTPSALSEGTFWDFVEDDISEDITGYFNFDKALFPKVQSVFSKHGTIRREVASELSLKEGIPVTYKAGDQMNNALSLNVFQPGEVAATAGTSGVIFSVSDKLIYDKQSRVNSFAHVNHGSGKKRIGILLCINGAGILNRWVRNLTRPQQSYRDLDKIAACAKPGAGGLVTIPFGNGAERILNNKQIGAHFQNLDLNVHSISHFIRSAQEGVAFAFRFGLDVMREQGVIPEVIRASRSNMFLSDVFVKSFAGATGTAVELYQTNGSTGAAIGAGIGLGLFTENDLVSRGSYTEIAEPSDHNLYEDLYQVWKENLQIHL